MTSQPPPDPHPRWSPPSQQGRDAQPPQWGGQQPYWAPTPPPGGAGPRPSMLVGGALLIALVFVAGLVIGNTGLLRAPVGGPTHTPNAGEPGTPAPPPPTLAPGQTPPPVTPPPLPTPPPGAPDDFALFWEAFDVIRENFVGSDELNELPLTYGAIRGLVDALGDTGHSVFLTPEALRREQESLSGTIVGVGALLGERQGRPVIVSVVSGGPASRAGVRSGDEILEVDGEDVTRLPPEEIAPRVRGDEGTTVVLTLFRPSTNETIEFAIVREEIRFPAANWAMVPGTQIGLLRFIQFSDGAAAELRAARDEAIAQGAQGLILDLRSNPGGLVHEAIAAASLFVDRETVYIRELADGSRIPVPARDDIPATDLPLVVLIDEGSASSAEILAGALRSAGRAELVGQTTFGTGTVLITFTLSDGSAVRIAIERWLTPDGELIFERGIEPTVEVALDPTARPFEPDEVAALDPAAVPTMEDEQLRRAIELLREAGVP